MQRPRIQLENGGPHPPATPESLAGDKTPSQAASPADPTATANGSTGAPHSSAALANGQAPDPSAPGGTDGAMPDVQTPSTTADAQPDAAPSQESRQAASPVTAAVAVFGTRSPAPSRLWGLPRSTAASLAFVPRGTTLHKHSQALSPQVSSMTPSPSHHHGFGCHALTSRGLEHSGRVGSATSQAAFSSICFVCCPSSAWAPQL